MMESTFAAAVVEVSPMGDDAEVVQVSAVAPGGLSVRFECFAGEYEVGGLVEVTVRSAAT